MGIGPDSDHYQHLGVGETIGGPFEDTAGPALNNFIKFVAVFSLVTEGLYQPTPDESTWMLGFAVIVGALLLIILSKFGLTLALNCITNFLKQRQMQKQRDVMEDDEA